MLEFRFWVKSQYPLIERKKKKGGRTDDRHCQIMLILFGCIQFFEKFEVLLEIG